MALRRVREVSSVRVELKTRFRFVDLLRLDDVFWKQISGSKESRGSGILGNLESGTSTDGFGSSNDDLDNENDGVFESDEGGKRLPCDLEVPFFLGESSELISRWYRVLDCRFKDEGVRSVRRGENDEKKSEFEGRDEPLTGTGSFDVVVCVVGGGLSGCTVRKAITRMRSRRLVRALDQRLGRARSRRGRGSLQPFPGPKFSTFRSTKGPNSSSTQDDASSIPSSETITSPTPRRPLEESS